MTWTFAKIAAAGVLAATPIAVVSLSACATAASSDTPVVRPAPLPADPQIEPEPPTPATRGGEYYNPSDYNDWWYNSGADGGGGGGGG